MNVAKRSIFSKKVALYANEYSNLEDSADKDYLLADSSVPYFVKNLEESRDVQARQAFLPAWICDFTLLPLSLDFMSHGRRRKPSEGPKFQRDLHHTTSIARVTGRAGSAAHRIPSDRVGHLPSSQTSMFNGVHDAAYSLTPRK